jgi:DNA-directed RNA polymerase specialized sigma24 family protein
MNPAKLLSQHVVTYFVKTNDENALVIIRERHEKKLVEWIKARYTDDQAAAEHIASETFVKVREKAGEYDETKPFSDWLCTLAGNVAINFKDGKRENHGRFTAIVACLPELERRYSHCFCWTICQRAPPPSGLESLAINSASDSIQPS